MSADPLPRMSVAELLADRLKGAILDGRYAPGQALREVALASDHGVSRHTVRSALRILEVEGLVAIVPQRGAYVARLDTERLIDLFALRTALELEGAHLALARGHGRLPDAVRAACAALSASAGRPRPSWRQVADRHAAFHSAIVAASGSPRIIAAYEALAAEMQLFLVQLRPVWPLARMGPHHEALVVELESEGPTALRRHIDEGLTAVLGPVTPSR